MPHKSVLLLQVFLKFEPEFCVHALKQLTRALGPGAKPVMHEKRHIGYVVTTRETAQELVDRLLPALEADSFADYTAVPVLGNAAGKHGGLNTLVTRIKMAYASLNTGPSEHLAKSQVFVKQRFRKDAPRQMGVEGRRDR